MLTKKVSSLNKNIQSKDTQIIELEQKIEEANRQVDSRNILFNASN